MPPINGPLVRLSGRFLISSTPDTCSDTPGVLTLRFCALSDRPFALTCAPSPKVALYLLFETTVATEAPTPTVPALAAAQALAPSMLVLVASRRMLPAWSMRVLAPMEAIVCAFDTATANAPATPTLLAPAPATPSAASLRAKAGDVFCVEVAVTDRSPNLVM